MMVLFIVLPLALIVVGVALWAFLWMVRSGQMDDLDTPPIRMLFDDEVAPRRLDDEHDDETGDPPGDSPASVNRPDLRA